MKGHFVKTVEKPEKEGEDRKVFGAHYQERSAIRNAQSCGDNLSLFRSNWRNIDLYHPGALPCKREGIAPRSATVFNLGLTFAVRGYQTGMELPTLNIQPSNIRAQAP